MAREEAAAIVAAWTRGTDHAYSQAGEFGIDSTI